MVNTHQENFIPLQAEVYADDAYCGRITSFTFNPVSRKATHVVVNLNGYLHLDFLVPLELLLTRESHRVTTTISCERFSRLQPFQQYAFIAADERWLELIRPYITTTSPIKPENAFLWPYVQAKPSPKSSTFDEDYMYAEVLGIEKGDSIYATDGFVGVVDEFIFDSNSHNITHLVIQQGHYWGEKDLAIPVSTIHHLEGNSVFLKFDINQLHQLPEVAIERW